MPALKQWLPNHLLYEYGSFCQRIKRIFAFLKLHAHTTFLSKTISFFTINICCFIWQFGCLFYADLNAILLTEGKPESQKNLLVWRAWVQHVWLNNLLTKCHQTMVPGDWLTASDWFSSWQRRPSWKMTTNPAFTFFELGVSFYVCVPNFIKIGPYLAFL